MGYFGASGYTMNLFVGNGGPESLSRCVASAIPSRQYLGSLDELRVFNMELTQDDICALYST